MDPILTQGKRGGTQPTAELVRELTDADLGLLAQPRGIGASPIKKLRDSHHALARALATGMDEGQAALITGYSTSRVSILKADPTFSELVAHYRGLAGAEFADLAARMTSVGVDALEEIRSRLEESPEEIPTGLLLQIVEKTADRTGFGPKSTTVNLNVNLAARLGEARRRVAEVRDSLPAATEGRLASRIIDPEAA